MASVGKPGKISLPVISTIAADLDAPGRTAARPSTTRGRGYRWGPEHGPSIAMTVTPGCGTVDGAIGAGASVLARGRHRVPEPDRARRPQGVAAPRRAQQHSSLDAVRDPASDVVGFRHVGTVVTTRPKSRRPHRARRTRNRLGDAPARHATVPIGPSWPHSRCRHPGRGCARSSSWRSSGPRRRRHALGPRRQHDLRRPQGHRPVDPAREAPDRAGDRGNGTPVVRRRGVDRLAPDAEPATTPGPQSWSRPA